MTRFSLESISSPLLTKTSLNEKGLCSASPSWSRFRSPDPKDDDSDSSSSYDDDESSDEEDEPFHPIGFWKLRTPTPEKREMEEWLSCHRSLPRARKLDRASTNAAGSSSTTPILLRHHWNITSRGEKIRDIVGEEKHQMECDGEEIDRIQTLLRAIAIVDSRNDTEQKARIKQQQVQYSSSNDRNNSKLYTLAVAAQQKEQMALQNYQMAQVEYRKKAEEKNNVLAQLIKRDQMEADQILLREKQQQQLMLKAQKDQEQQQLRQQQESEDKKIKEQQQKKLEEEQSKIKEAAIEKARNEKEMQQKAITENEKKEKSTKLGEDYVIKAVKSIDMLQHVRNTLVKPFEEDKSVSKRRLQYKKMAKGKLNTLARNEEKIHQVTQLFLQVCQDSVREDSASQTNGLLYFLDLLCSNVLVRVQSDVFNGTKGDGFPIAACLSQLSLHQKELSQLLEAHLFTSCPMAIPRLPDHDSNNSSSLEEKLGMLEGETFERFLARTEGMISMMGNIMCSVPEEHGCFEGKKGALIYLDRFLNLFPLDDQEGEARLPLLTAPVLVAFLTATGHMLAHKYTKEFSAQLTKINTSVLPRCDTTTIGQPSFTRLKKVLDGGIESFKTNPPPGSIQSLYFSGNASFVSSSFKPSNNNNNSGIQSSGAFNNSDSKNNGFSSNNPFGNKVIPNNPSNAFSGSKSASPFGASNSSSSTAPSGFGGAMTTNNSISPFGANKNSTVSSSSFGNNNSFASFGQATNNNNASSASMMSDDNDSSMNANIITGTSPFGTNNNNMSTNPFGSAGNSINKTNNSTNPFSQSTPFGNASSNSTAFADSKAAASPFGTSSNSFQFGQTTNNNQYKPSTPFGSSNMSTNNSPFASSNNNSNSPFGGPSNNNTNKNQFGNNNYNNQNKLQIPCRFFAKGTCRNGANCRYLHSTPDNKNSNQSSFGGGSNGFSNGINISNPFGGPRR